MSTTTTPLRILHLPTWYPNEDNPYEAIWLKRHIEALDAHCENEVYRLEIKKGTKWRWKSERSDARTRQLQVETKLPWRVVEYLNIFILAYLCWFKLRLKRYDLVNVHIAYPLLTHTRWVKRLLGKKIIITEHWSAYHLNFGMPDKTKLGRVQQIFHHGFPLIAVSQALIQDIQRFAGRDDFPSYCIPNIVESHIFNHTNQRRDSLFIVSNWQRPKQPELLMKAFAALAEDYPDLQLRIGGYGALWEEMQALAQDLGIAERVAFLGKLPPEEVAAEMNRAKVFMHASGYETFSVVCAEAICCGTPVLASKVGGIVEFIRDDENGYLIESMGQEYWKNGIKRLLEQDFDHAQIAQKAQAQFSPEAVGKAYCEVLQRYGS